MALMKMMSLCLLSSALAVPAPDLSRDKRDAAPLLTNFVHDITRPFRNLFRVSSSQKRPAVTHHHHQHQNPRPRPHHVVHHPTPAQSVHYPPPQVHYPEPVYHEAPAPKPQIHILPAPDLSHAPTYDEPAPVTYVETSLPTYEAAPPPVYEAPAPPPVYEAPAPVYDAPAPPPVYDAPAPPPVYDEPAPPPAPTYVEAAPPVYEPASVPDSDPAVAPAYEPDTSVINDGPLWYDSQYKPDLVEEKKPESVPAVEVIPKTEEVLAPLVQAETEDREPKALLNTGSIDIQISNDVDEEPIIIDLTSNQQKNNDEDLITGEEADQQPQLITFGAPQPVSNLRPVKITDEVISFTAQQDLPSNINFESFEIRPVESVPTQNIPTTEAPREEEAVTPIVANQELRSFFAQNEIPSDNVEVIDLRGQLTLLNEDDQESFVPSSQEQEVTVLDETTEAISIATPQTASTATTTSITTTQTTTTTSTTTTQTTTTIQTSFEPTETEVAQTTTTSTEAPQTTTELRRITFQILENDQTKDFPDSAQEITFEEVEAFQSSPDSFSAVTETEEAPTDIPPTISSDPVFQEIVNAGAGPEKSKRKSRYDPRARGVYAHRYNDNFSNWYYYRSGF